ncbi:MAG: endonuclease domain-containing protein [Dongiaceae bacterium]
MTTARRPRSLRKTSSLAERTLWERLRNRKLHGYKFRRQQLIGPYTADFVCLEGHLIVELDGGHHVLRADADRLRDTWLGREGYRVLRIRHLRVLNEVNEVLHEILAALQASNPSPPAPSPPRGEGLRK